MRTLPCGGFKTYDYFSGCYDYDCDYGFDSSCEECVCTGGKCDPRYPFDKQPKNLSKFIIHTQKVNEEINRREYERDINE